MNQISIKKKIKTIRGHGTKAYPLFLVPIGNAKMIENIMFNPEAPMLKYHQKLSNSFCLSSLTPAFHIIGDNRDVPALADNTEESLTLQTDRFRYVIDFSNDMMKNKIHHKCEQHLIYNMKAWKKKGDFDILN